jgi:DNA-3-methyladenine glycosylase II
MALKAWKIFARKNPNAWRHWKKMPLDEYKSEIMSIWGFGNWAADMIGIFHLGRPDIWPETDAGIQKMSRIVFGGKVNIINLKKMLKGRETLTALYFWEYINRGLHRRRS